MSDNQNEKLHRELLAGAKPLDLYGNQFNVARTPAGAGLQAYMTMLDRRRTTIWNKLPPLSEGMTPEERKAVLEERETIINDALRLSHIEDTRDLITALYFSIARLDPTVPRDLIAQSIDGSNQEGAFLLLLDVNRTVADPNVAPLMALMEAAGDTSLTPTTGETG